ncbi:glyoxylase-like metal-dependent hydrolase (beta-lactamase superfamily II) [Bradyrhizobium sp. USDA 4011]
MLIDSGTRGLYGDCCGHLVENLTVAGYRPEQIDEVYLTHLHADHVGGSSSKAAVRTQSLAGRETVRELVEMLDRI